MIVKNLEYVGYRNCHFLEVRLTGDSPAVDMPDYFKVVTVMLSSVTGGTAKIQFSMSTIEAVQLDTAIWHDCSTGNITTEGGLAIDSPITFIRVLASPTVSYILEVLS